MKKIFFITSFILVFINNFCLANYDWLLFSPDGKYFIVQSYRNYIYVGEFSAKSKKFIRKISLPSNAFGFNIVNINSKNIFVSFPYQNEEKTHIEGYQLWTLDFKGKAIQKIPAVDDTVSWNFKYICKSEEHGKIGLYQLINNESTLIYKLSSDDLCNNIDFSRKGNLFAYVDITTKEKQGVSIINLNNGKIIRRISIDRKGGLLPVSLVKFSPDNKFLAIGTIYGLTLYSLSENKTYYMNYGEVSVNNIAFSQDGRYIAVDFSDIVRIYSLKNYELIKEKSFHGASIRGLSFSPDGKNLGILYFENEEPTVKFLSI